MTGCSASVSVGSASSSGSASAAASAPASSSSAPEREPSTDTSLPASAEPNSGPFVLVSQGLEKEGAQAALDASANDSAAVASVLSETTADDYDAGIVYSGDGGATWTWGGVLADAGKSYPEAIALVPAGAIMVGTNQVVAGDAVASRAFLAAASAPDFVPRAVEPPEQFAGDDVHLQDVVVVGDEWVVAGYLQGEADASGVSKQTSVLWRSADQGATWTKQVIDVPGSSDNSIKQLVIAPDGSWNLVGQVVYDKQANQYDPLWLRSTDAGATFDVMSKQELAGPFDQGVTRIVFAADGSAALLGWDEVTDESGSTASALWTSGPDMTVSRVGTTEVPVVGGTPPGEFIDGILWDGPTLAAWGSPTGDYPMDNVQFWGLIGGQLTQSSMLSGGGTPIAVGRILIGGNTALAFGFSGAQLPEADVAIWRGSIVAPADASAAPSN